MDSWDIASYRFRGKRRLHDEDTADALRRSEDRYRLLFESIDQGFCVVQMLYEQQRPVDYRFLEVNPAFEAHTGLKQALGKCISELAGRHDDHWLQIYGDVALTGQPTRFEHRAEGLKRCFDVYAFRLGEPEDATVAVLFTDITEHYEMEIRREQLLEAERAARHAAEAATRLKDEFLATLSHELRTPLSVIIGWSQLLLKRADPADQQQIKGLSTILQSARTQATLISDMLDMSAIFLGKTKLELEPLDGFEHVARVVQSSEPSMQGKNIHLEFQHSFEVCLLLADATRLQQILWNLLSNAIKFTPPNGRISIGARRAGACFEISVADSGVGIAPEFLPHLFDRFRQADGSTSRRYGGLGLGLSIVKHLVEMHGGEVRAESEGLNRGACFVVSLPVYDTPLAGSDAPAEKTDLLHADALKGERILAVEDQPDMLEYLVHVLQEYGAKVTGVASAYAALDALADRAAPAYTTLVADIGMPGMDGYQLMDAIRVGMGIDAQMLRAVAVTALAREDDRQRALDCGFQAHVVKPYRAVSLVAAIRGGADEGRGGRIGPGVDRP